MKIAEDTGKIVFKYLFCQGPADKSYGVHVAQMAGLPNEVIEKATEILAGFEEEGLGYLGNKHSARQLKLF
jgi:DNA mismatch repair protein MutS